MKPKKYSRAAWGTVIDDKNPDYNQWKEYIEDEQKRGRERTRRAIEMQAVMGCERRYLDDKKDTSLGMMVHSMLKSADHPTNVDDLFHYMCAVVAAAWGRGTEEYERHVDFVRNEIRKSREKLVVLMDGIDTYYHPQVPFEGIVEIKVGETRDIGDFDRVRVVRESYPW